MEIPFILKFLEKIELFQVINKLNKQFEEQIKELEKDSKKVLPLWQTEKKILFWTYKNHKHLGSPLKVDVLKSKKLFLLKELGYYDNTGYKEARNLIKHADSDKIELNLKGETSKAMEKITTGDKDDIYERCKKIGNEIYKMKLTAKEIEKANVRRVFGNLVSRSYARFYPEITKESSHWEKENDFMSREVYKDATTTQFNCEGILITQDGMLMGELLNDLYKIKEINSKSNKIAKIYEEKTGANYFLEKNSLNWIYYQFFIGIGYVALITIILTVFKELFLLIKSVINYLYPAINYIISC